MISYGEDYIPRDISLVLDVNNKFKTLVAADLVNISLTSREEYIAFYEREYKRLGGKMYVWSSYEKMDFSMFDPLYYFKKVETYSKKLDLDKGVLFDLYSGAIDWLNDSMLGFDK